MDSSITDDSTANQAGPGSTGEEGGSVAARGMHRRRFLLASAGAATAGILPAAAATPLAPQDRNRRRQPAPIPSNELAPSLQFQAAPEGTGAFAGATPPTVSQDPIDAELEEWSGEVPQDETEIAFLPVHRLAVLIRDGELSPVKLTEIYLNRLERLDEKLLCTVNLMKESALAQARRAEQEIEAGDWRGPLHGIPWGVKDLFATRGAPTTWGAKPFEHRVIDEDSTVVERLADAGAILIAKLATGTFALGDRWFRGRTRNPWNLEQGSSGSSAGPASATAAGCVGFAIGTETLGSIVSPARRCGNTALRPTYGRVSKHGCMTLSWSMDKVGPFARCAEDCALVFAAIHGADPKDPSTLDAPFEWDPGADLSALRIGTAENADANFLNLLRSLGADPQPVGPRPSARFVRDILSAESAAAFADFTDSDAEKQMVVDQGDRFRSGRETSAVDYLQSQRLRLQVMREMQEFFADLDLYVSPNGDLSLTNLTGHPSVVLPSGFEQGRPRTIMLVGNLFADDKLLAVAHAVQSETDWHLRHPALG